MYTTPNGILLIFTVDNVGAEYLYLLIAIPQEFQIVNTCPLGAPLQQNFRQNSTENSAEIYGKKGAEKYLEVRISNSLWMQCFLGAPTDNASAPICNLIVGGAILVGAKAL